MVRSTSLASFNLEKSGRVQSLVKDDIDSQSICFGGIHRYTLRISAVVASSDTGDVMADLLDWTTQQHLERRGVLNWHPDFGRLAVIKMSGNGHCLLHAISTYMWGIQDSDQTLQKLMCRALSEPTSLSRSLRKRFMEHLVGMGNARCQSAQEDLQRKWDAVVSVASTALTQQVDHDLLLRAFEIYIFTMAQILRRPIVVLAEDVHLTCEGGPSFSLSGIYLPLQWPAEECVKNPIMLAYHSQQFFPLLSTQPPQQATSPGPIDAVPLVRQNGESLPVHLLLPEEVGRVQEYVNQHIDTTSVQDHHGNSMVAARMGSLTPPDEYNLLLDIFQQVAEGSNPAEAREAPPGSAGLENRNGAAADQGVSVFCTQGAEGLTSHGTELDQQMLRMSIQKEAVSHGNSHPHASLPCTDEIRRNLGVAQVRNLSAASRQSIQTSHSATQGEVNNHRATSSEQGGWQQNNVLPGDASATVESIQDEDHASRANGRSSRIANDNRAQWEATGAKPKQRSGSKSKDGSRKMGNPPARDKSICKTSGCLGKAVPRTGGYCMDCYTRKSQEERKIRFPRQNPSADGPAPQQRQARKTLSAGQGRQQQAQSGVAGKRSVSSAPTTGKNSSLPQSRRTIKEQISMPPVNTPTSTANTGGSLSETVNNTQTRPEVPQSNDPGSRSETAFLPNSGPPSSTIYASSGGQSSATSTHDTEASMLQSTNNVSTARMHHNAGEEPLGPSLYHARTTARQSAEGTVPENHPYIPANHLVKCSACDTWVNKDINVSLCEECHQFLGQRNQASLPNNGTPNLGQGSSAGANTRQAARDAAGAVMASDVSSPKYKYQGRDSAANPPTRNQQAVHMPSELQSSHQRSSQQQQAELSQHQTVSPPDLFVNQLASRPCFSKGCKYIGTRECRYLCSFHYRETVMASASSNHFGQSGNFSQHTSLNTSPSMQGSVSCNTYYNFEPGSTQTFHIHHPPSSDNSVPKVPGSAEPSVPFPPQPDYPRAGVHVPIRSRGSCTPPNEPSPTSRNNPSPPLSARQGPSPHMMHGQSSVNGTCKMRGCKQKGDLVYGGFCPQCFEWIQRNAMPGRF